MRKRLIDILVAFMFGLSIFLFFGAYTRNWIESTPTDTTVANQIDDFNRNVRVDTAERLEDYVAGFNSGDSNEGFYHVLFIENAASLSTPAADKGLLYGVLANSKCELAYEDEDGDMVQLTTGGKMGGAHVELVANMDLLGSSTSDITINTDKFTVAGATGNTSVGGTFESVGVTTLADASVTKTTAAPGADAQIANKKYVDDQDALSAYTNEDADGTALLKAHAYEAATDGFVKWTASPGTSKNVQGFVETAAQFAIDSDPTSGGARVAYFTVPGTQSVGDCMPVAKGECFELTTDGTAAIAIYWKSIGTLSKPIDQD